MNRKIQLIWDFYGERAEKIAQHHLTHVQEFMSRENLSYSNHGLRTNADLHYLAFITIQEADVVVLRDSLKPHRAFVVKED